MDVYRSDLEHAIMRLEYAEQRVRELEDHVGLERPKLTLAKTIVEVASALAILGLIGFGLTAAFSIGYGVGRDSAARPAVQAVIGHTSLGGAR